MEGTTLFLIAAVGLGMVGIWMLGRHDRVRARTERQALFSDCTALFDDVRIELDSAGFPRLLGTYADLPVRLDLILDTLGYRKLPSLWLQANLVTGLKIGGAIDLLARPANVEFYSPAANLPIGLALPASWPQFATLRADFQPVGGFLNRLTSNVVELFSDPHVKELLLAPKGIRVTRQVAQAALPHYLFFRAVSFDQLRVDPEVVTGLLRAMLAIRAEVTQE